MFCNICFSPISNKQRIENHEQELSSDRRGQWQRIGAGQDGSNFKPGKFWKRKGKVQKNV